MEKLTPLVCAGRLISDRLALTCLFCLVSFLDTRQLCAAPIDVSKFNFEVEALCYDDDNVFAGDGDYSIRQYWRINHELVYVRSLPTNPDVEVCAVSDDTVYYIDPAIGVLSYEKSPEREIVARLVYTGPPHGTGKLNPTAMQLIMDNGVSTIALTDDAGDFDQIRLASSSTNVLPQVKPSLQTEPVAKTGDVADDSVILATPTGDVVWIVGTDKKEGLRIYDLKGKELHFLNEGALNNVDAVEIDSGRFLLAASNRTTRSLDLFTAAPDENRVEFLGRTNLDLDDPYGLCMARLDGDINVFVGGKDGTVQRWQVNESADFQRTDTIKFDSQTEGCVVDTVNQALFVGEEEVGLWRVALATGERKLVDSVTGDWIAADIEGMDIYDYGDGRYLLVSSQGDDSFVLYELPEVRPLVKFEIGPSADGKLDGVSETDGLSISSQSVRGFPGGFVVLQDGHNVAPQANQNFKILDWRELQKLIQ